MKNINTPHTCRIKKLLVITKRDETVKGAAAHSACRCKSKGVTQQKEMVKSWGKGKKEQKIKTKQEYHINVKAWKGGQKEGRKKSLFVRY